MSYVDDVKKIVANSNVSIEDEENIVVKNMCILIEKIIDYRYAARHYKGNNLNVLEDKVASIKNAMSVTGSNLDIYAEMLNIYEKVEYKKVQRITKMNRP